MGTISVFRTDELTPAEGEQLSLLLSNKWTGASDKDTTGWRRFVRWIQSREIGEMVEISIKRIRNARFHRKFFALLRVGFDAWEPDRVRYSYKGREIAKNFDKFREDITILAGYYDQVFNIKGEMSLKAKSISFAKMEEDEFERLYNDVADVILARVCTRYAGRAELDDVVDRVMRFV